MSAGDRCPASAAAPDPVDAVVAVIVRGRRVLMVRRADGRPAAGWWCPPSGRVEPGEDQPSAVAREMREELGLDAVALEHLETLPTEDGAYALHYWRTSARGSPRPDPAEASALAWCDGAALRRLSPTFEDDVRICLAELHRGRGEDVAR